MMSCLFLCFELLSARLGLSEAGGHDKGHTMELASNCTDSYQFTIQQSMDHSEKIASLSEEMAGKVLHLQPGQEVLPWGHKLQGYSNRTPKGLMLHQLGSSRSKALIGEELPIF